MITFDELFDPAFLTALSRWDLGARRVAGAKIWLGALSHLSAEHFREHFAIEARDTLAAGAVLEIEVSNDPADPHAQHVRLESVDLDE